VARVAGCRFHCFLATEHHPQSSRGLEHSKTLPRTWGPSRGGEQMRTTCRTAGLCGRVNGEAHGGAAYGMVVYPPKRCASLTKEGRSIIARGWGGKCPGAKFLPHFPLHPHRRRRFAAHWGVPAENRQAIIPVPHRYGQRSHRSISILMPILISIFRRRAGPPIVLLFYIDSLKPEG